jgi:CubicO group peptidase (beta-lactamase class C family)
MNTLRFAALLALLITTTTRTPAQESTPSTKGIAAALQPFVDRHELAGAVTLVANGDKFLSIDTVGYADVAAKRPMSPDATFWIASMSKPITAAGLMILVDEGKVSLDDPIEKHLPEFKGQWLVAEKDKDHMLLKKPMRSPTVRDVLDHTSGMPFVSAMEQPTIDVLPLRDAVRSYAMTPLQTEPGSKYAYSNAGINTAGRIIEVVGGMPYEEFLDKRLFTPLGMMDTTFWPSDSQLKRLAKSYKPTKSKDGLDETTITALRYPLDDRKRFPVPGGGLFSTAQDVGHFCQMVLNGGTFHGKRILTENAVKQMTSKQTGEALKEGYGLGWSVGDGNFGHGGAYATNMNIDPKRNLITVYMVQHAGFPGEGGKSRGAFQKTAEEKFAAPKK